MPLLGWTVAPFGANSGRVVYGEDLDRVLRDRQGRHAYTGVAKINPDHDLDEVYSQEIIVTAPERIFSYDESRMEMDCTEPGKGKGKRFIKSVKDDDGEVIVTKSSKTATSVCGRLEDGRPLSVYMVLASGEEHDVEWASEIS